MSALSKLCGDLGMKVITTTCYETAHTWNPSCRGALIDLYKAAIPFAFRTYAPLHLVSLHCTDESKNLA